MTLFSSIADLSEDSDEENPLLLELENVSRQEAERARLAAKLAKLKEKVAWYQTRIYSLKNQNNCDNTNHNILDTLIMSNDLITKSCSPQRVFQPIRHTKRASKLLGSLHSLGIDKIETKDSQTAFQGSCRLLDSSYKFEFSGNISAIDKSITVQVYPLEVETEIRCFLQKAPSTVLLYGLSQYSVIWRKRAKVFDQLSHDFSLNYDQKMTTITTFSFQHINGIQLDLEWLIKLNNDGNAQSVVRLFVNDMPNQLHNGHVNKLQQLFIELVKYRGVFFATCVVVKIIQS